MKKITYYVAASLDGYIADQDGNVDRFSQDQDFLDHYYSQLNTFETVIMGKATYEFGYQFGLKPGELAYPHMDHFIFSKSIDLPSDSKVNVVRDSWVEKVDEIKEASPTQIYMCGGSQFAGFLLENNLIDELIVKINPFCMGTGIPLFETEKAISLELLSSNVFKCGITENHYRINN